MADNSKNAIIHNMGKMRISSVITFPIHDPKGLLFDHLWKITPVLRENFSKCFISITPTTLQNQKDEVENLTQDPFFDVIYNKEGSLVGDHFVTLYQRVVKACTPDTIVHLATEDRLAFVLETEFKKAALKDFKEASKIESPLLFQRSKRAWDTHPKNYFAAEFMITQAGKALFGKSLDFAWCHLVLKADDLQKVLPKIESHDLTVFAELIFYLREKIKIKEVDWLSWEDPYILGKDSQQLKLEYEQDQAETDKRLGYAVPIIKMLFNKDFSIKTKSQSLRL